MRDPYQVLGVDRRADAETIRKAYKKLARRWHPDINDAPEADGRFKSINAAYDIVGDAEKRKLWDEFGEASTRPGFDAARARAFRGGARGFDFGGGGSDLDDLLGSIFGQGGTMRRRKAPDQHVDLSITFLEAVLGTNRTITIERSGSREQFEVPIPAGASDGGKVRLRGRGAPARPGSPAGDLVVRLRVLPHPHLVRSGDDLELEVPVTVLEAIRGASITVPTPAGDIRLNVPAGVRTGTKLRVRGRGVQRKGSPGDLYVVLRPVVPESSDPEVLAAAERIERAYATDPRASLKLQ